MLSESMCLLRRLISSSYCSKMLKNRAFLMLECEKSVGFKRSTSSKLSALPKTRRHGFSLLIEIRHVGHCLLFSSHVSIQNEQKACKFGQTHGSFTLPAHKNRFKIKNITKIYNGILFGCTFFYFIFGKFFKFVFKLKVLI